MPSQSYVPTNEAARLVWLGNYKAKLPILGALCGLSAAEIAETLNDIACVMWMMQIWYPVIQQGALGATAFKTLMTNGSGSTPLTLPRLPEFADAPRMCLPGVFPRISNQVVRIKASPGYTEVIGRELGIIGHNDDLQYPVPDLTASLEQGNGQQLWCCNTPSTATTGRISSPGATAATGSSWPSTSTNPTATTAPCWCPIRRKSASSRCGTGTGASPLATTARSRGSPSGHKRPGFPRPAVLRAGIAGRYSEIILTVP
jgi:hypothetical protein